jgi:hypothetical protein
MTLFGVFDTFVSAREVTAIMFLDSLIFIEAFGFMLLFAFPAVYVHDFPHKETKDLIGLVNFWILVATLIIALISRIVQIPSLNIRDAFAAKEKQNQAINGIILGWEKERRKKRQLAQIDNGSQSEDFSSTDSSHDEEYKEKLAVIRRKEVAFRY